MIAIRWTCMILTACVCWPAVPGSLFAADPETSYALLTFNRNGELTNRDDWDQLVTTIKKTEPTHVFLLAHGWNNSKEEAQHKYDSILKHMAKVAGDEKLRPDGYRPIVVGLYWPSLAFDRSEDLIKDLTKDAGFATLALLPALREKVNVKDLDRLVKLVEIARPFIPQKWRDRIPVIEKKDIEGLEEVNTVETVADVLRVFSYWHMKKRAGTVGVEVRPLLRQLQEASPKTATFHLIGHSFGCKLWLSALADDTKPITVDTLILLQAAVSNQAFADEVVIKDKKGNDPDRKMPGGYQVVRQRVKGPIVATFTRRDWPVRNTYPLGSRTAGHVAELDVRARHQGEAAYRGMGAHGIEGAQRLEPQKPGAAFGFKKQGGLYNFDADANDLKAITGHSKFYTPEVAWLIWAAVLRK